MPDYTKNPLKTAYVVYFICSFPARILYLALTSIPRPLRQHPTWSFLQSFGTSVFKQYWAFMPVVEYKTAQSLKPGSDGPRFIVMPPAEPESCLDVLSPSSGDGNVRPVEIGGMWYPQTYSPATDAGKKVVINFHGGVYVLGGCRPLESGWGVEMLARNLHGFVLQPQYRLAVYKDSHFPAALQDGLTSYKYVLGLGVKAEDIVLSGDSAGANLALGLLRYLEEHKGETGLPLPGAILLWSPWVDLTIDPRTIDTMANAKTDYIPGATVAWGLRKYIPKGVDPSHPYISPHGNEFATSVPIFVQTGALEVLRDSIVEFAEGMRKIKGNYVELFEIDRAPHDTFAAGILVGFVKEAEVASQRACDLIVNGRGGETGKNERI